MSKIFVPLTPEAEALVEYHEKRYAALQASHEELMKALDAMINERYSELDMMCCEYPRGSTEAIAWEAGVRQAWKLWDLSKQPGQDALSNAAKLAPPN